MNQDITLNIHYTIPNELWLKLLPEIKKLNENGVIYSVEPGGLQFYSENDDLPEQVWNDLISDFCEKASEILGFPVGDACGDFPCIPFK